MNLQVDNIILKQDQNIREIFKFISKLHLDKHVEFKSHISTPEYINDDEGKQYSIEQIKSKLDK